MLVSTMQTLNGMRFIPVVRVAGTLLGLDVRWLRGSGLLTVVLLALATPAGPLHDDGTLPLWVRIAIGLSSVAAVAITSLGHELGHALAGRLAGLTVRAIVLAPHGSVTIRSASILPHVNFRTALAGPLANGLLASACAALAWWALPDSFAWVFLTRLGALQLLSGVANLLPFRPMDGAHIVAAWRACRATA